MIGSVARRRPGDAAVVVKPASIDELRAADRRLQAAQLAEDTAALDQLLDDRVLFTSGSTARATPNTTIYICIAPASRS